MADEALERTVDRPIGGQAVVEGVMIRSPERIATAVRDPDGDIVVRSDPYVSLTKRIRGFGLPLVRGIVTFGEMMAIGLETLNYSASIAFPDDEPPTFKDKVVSFFISMFAIGIGVAVFFMLPLAIADVLGLVGHPVAYNLVAGGTRITLLVSYLWVIGRFKDMSRVFAYHGAEHQVVFAYEAGDDITIDAAKRHSRFHPRCGTSFMLIVVLLAVFTYALIDTTFTILAHRSPLLVERILTHLVFLPFVAGISFEGLKASGAYRGSPLVRMLIAPGLWLQRLTTRAPDDMQLAVAVRAARASLGLPTTSEAASVISSTAAA